MSWTDRTDVAGRYGWLDDKPHPPAATAAVWILHVNDKWYVSGMCQTYDAFGPYKTVAQAQEAGEILFEAGLLTRTYAKVISRPQ